MPREVGAVGSASSGLERQAAYAHYLLAERVYGRSWIVARWATMGVKASCVWRETCLYSVPGASALDTRSEEGRSCAM